MTEKIQVPHYDKITKEGKCNFLRQIKEEKINNKYAEKEIIEFKYCPNTGVDFIIQDKTSREIGTLYLYDNKLYMVNKQTRKITPVNCDNLETLKNRYQIFYKDNQSLKAQKVFIENEDDIQVDSGIVLSFKKINPNNPNSNVYLKGIYNGNFKKTETKKLFTGYCNVFYADGEYEGGYEDGGASGLGAFYREGNINYIGELKNNTMNGQGTGYTIDGKCICEWINGKANGYGLCFNTNGDIIYKGIWLNDEKDIFGEYYDKKGNVIYVGNHNKGKRCGEGKDYHPITIQHGEFKNDWLYSGNGYLREDPKDKSIEELNNEQINPENKIYTLEKDETNPDIRTLKFHTKHPKIGLDRDIQIHIDGNNVATLQGEPLTEYEINKIKQFFKNIPMKQLDAFDNYLAILYYTTIMNKEEYKDTNILIPDLCKYNYKEGEEVDQTIKLINQIPQEKRKGKYIVPCMWLENEHQVNLRIDFDDKICEIVNTGEYIDEEVINNLQQTSREEFKGEEWVVYENHMIKHSTGNCVIASNITATEKTVLEKQVEEYFKKKDKLEEIKSEMLTLMRKKPSKQQSKQQIERSKQVKQKEKKDLETEIQKYLNLMISSDENKEKIKREDFEKNVKFFSTMYDKQIRRITSTQPVMEQKKFSTINCLLKERLLGNENINKQFDEGVTNYTINNKQAIII